MIKKTNFKQSKPTSRDKESVIEQNVLSKTAWERWQESYHIIRRKIFLDILKK
jgi:hypothetical protein